MNLGEILVRGGAAQRPALVDTTASTVATYADLDRRSRRLAAALAHSTGPGDRVGIVMANRAELVVAYLGVLRAGRIAVLVNPSSPDAAIDRELETVGAAMRLDAAAVQELEHSAAGDDHTTADMQAHDTAVLLFTSGTAGAPKAAMLTHGSLLANLEQVASAPRLALTPADVALGVLPLFHVYGLNTVLGCALHRGASVLLVEAFHPVDTANAVRDAGVTMLAAVPAVYSAFLAADAADIADTTFANVRLAVSGAAALGNSVPRDFEQRFGVRVYDGYGLTEASPIVSTTAVDEPIRAGSIGPPLPGVEVRLVGDDGDAALVGDPGEIWVRGPNVFPGYWNDPEQTAAVLTPDGWLRTGDIAVADGEGWLTLVDRSKDLIIVSGFNVYPAEVEDALLLHENVAEAAVVGEPDARSGERIVAFVVPAEAADPPTATQLIAHLRHHLARYKIPAQFEIVPELPRTVTGKVLRRILRVPETPR
ncbi:MAG TPA: AMP-binding protein [Acidimicrobiia bacterium]